MTQLERPTLERLATRARTASPVSSLHVAKLLVAGLMLAFLTACAPTQVSLKEGPREYVASDYENVLRKWTRTEHLIALSDLENFLTATATFESWDFRWAYVVRYVQDYRLTIEQRQKLLDRTLEETRRNHQFFVAIYGGERRHNDLTKPDSAWIVRLIDDTGNETAPEEIVAIKKPNALERTYFPYNTVFRQAFRIRFPRVTPEGEPTISPDAAWFGLRFAGAKGNSELIWLLQEDAAPNAGPPPVARFSPPAPAWDFGHGLATETISRSSLEPPPSWNIADRLGRFEPSSSGTHSRAASPSAR